MNAVDRVRKKFESQPIQPFNYDEGYVKALNDVDEEYSKEVSCDYEEECMCLKKELDRLTKEYNRESELSSSHATIVTKMCEEMKQKDNKLLEYKAKLEMVELIFGGK